MKREEYEARKERQKQYYAGDSWNADSLKRTLEIIENTFIGQMNHLGFECPDGYEFKDENGNVIKTQKIFLEKKKPKYPSTFKECCKVLLAEETYVGIGGHKGKLLEKLQRLLICRDAYWKIAGEEIGLWKPWKPDWDELSKNHEFIKINKGCFTDSSRVLVFPTEEMRDAFYKNFKDLIEDCKELL